MNWNKSQPEDDNQHDNEQGACVKRYKEMLDKKESYFFDTEELLEIYDYYFHELDYAKALEVCLYAQEMHPGAHTFELKRAAALFKLGKEAQAMDIINNFEALWPDEHELHLLKAHIFLNRENPLGAIESFKKALINAEEKAPIYHDLAFASADTGDCEQAVRYMKLYISSGTNDYFLSQQFVIWLAATLKLDEGILFFEKILDEDPYNLDAWIAKGLIYKELEDYTAAIDAYSYPIAVEENNIAALGETADCYFALDQYKDALLYYERAANINPDNPIYWYHIGECFEWMGDHNAAKMNYQRCIKLNQNFPAAWYSMGMVLSLNFKWFEASHYYKKAVELEPDNAEFWFALGDCQSNLNHYKEACECYENVIGLDPAHEIIWLEYSILLYENNEPERALEVISEGIKYFPDNADFQYQCCGMLYENGYLKESYQMLEFALSNDFETHTQLFEIIPGIKSDKNIMTIIEQYRK
ncbi:MAG: tetratricopeptide repeat protein [Bacteroidetes bacterium]|nr:tetratricopeptide repeat protein [Bacteroidota bacterium]